MRKAEMIIAGSLLGAAVLGCRRPDPAHLAEADRLLAAYDSLSLVVNALDTAAYRQMGSIFGMQRVWFDDRFRDTLDTTTAMILGNYHRAMNGPLQELINGREQLLMDLDSSQAQVARLHHDLSEALLDDEQIPPALATEREHLAQWTVNVGVLQQGATAIDRAWEQYHIRVDSLMAATDSTSNVN